VVGHVGVVVGEDAARRSVRLVVARVAVLVELAGVGVPDEVAAVDVLDAHAESAVAGEELSDSWSCHQSSSDQGLSSDAARASAAAHAALMRRGM